MPRAPSEAHDVMSYILIHPIGLIAYERGWLSQLSHSANIMVQ